MKFIAEIGTNFDPNDPLEALGQAAEAGADIVKVQLFQADTLYAMPDLQKRVAPFQFHPEWLAGWNRDIPVWASVFDIDLAEKALPYLKGLKVASGDLTCQRIVEGTARLASDAEIPLALSTGAATGEEVRRALEWVHPFPVPRLYLFQCVSAYPARPEWYNLRAILPFKGDVDAIGLSDHTVSFVTAMIARALGYELFERHFRFSEAWPAAVSKLGQPPDWGPWAFPPPTFREYRHMIEWADEVLGDGVKGPIPEELEERVWARRGKDGLRPLERARRRS